MLNQDNNSFLELIIDCNEHNLINAMDSEYLKKECGHVYYDVEKLDVGDIIFRCPSDKKIYCLIERKTYEDYASSIKDKRLKNQSMRISQLKKDNPEIVIIYLIEGKHIHKDHKFFNGITRDALYSSIVNKVLRDKFIIYYTADINDTALIISKFYDKLPEHYNPCLTKINDEKIEYLKTIKVTKKNNLTPQNTYICQLSQIPGVSIDIANIIYKYYPSMKQLIFAYERCQTTVEKEQLLANLVLPIANEKLRKLGKILSKKIYEYICYDELPKENLKFKVKLKNTENVQK